MNFLKDRRVVIVGGVAVALVAGLGLAKLVMSRDGGAKTPETAPAGQPGLVVEMGRDDDAKLDPKRELRCFVGGQFVGLATLADCAKKNGVATGSLDVGVDQSGALAAASGAGPAITPLPPQAPAAAPAPAGPPAPAAQPAATEAQPAGKPAGQACWRYAGGDWRKLSEVQSLGACVQALFAGKCERTGGASYGRWGEQTLRLVPGRVEQSSDNKSFRLLVEQTPSCGVPQI